MKRIVRLGDVTSEVTKAVLEDKELRKELTQATKSAVHGGVSIVKGTLYAIGGIILLGVAVWGVKTAVKVGRENKERRLDDEVREEQMAETSGKRSKTDAWFKDAAQKLKVAMDYNEGFNHWGSDYDNERIVQILESLESREDWIYLMGVFRKCDGHNLLEWLGCDGFSDRQRYNNILKKLDVDPKDMITATGWLKGTEDYIL